MPVRRPEEFTHHEAQLDGIKIHYVREGRGPPLILMHGWPGFWWEWYKCIGALADDFDVIAPDMRGYGDFEKPDLRDLSKYHLNVVTDDHAKLLQHLGINAGLHGGARLFGPGHAQVRPPLSRHDDQRAHHRPDCSRV